MQVLFKLQCTEARSESAVLCEVDHRCRCESVIAARDLGILPPRRLYIMTTEQG